MQSELIVESKEKKKISNPRFFIPLLILFFISIAGIFAPDSMNLKQIDPKVNSADVAWMLTATALVFLMTPGLSFFYGGMVGYKNIISTMFQSFVALGVISLLWVVVGFSLAFGDSIGAKGMGLIGNPFSFFMFNHVGLDTNADLSPTIPLMLFALFQLKFAIITPALITGSLTERIRFSSYLLFMVLFSIFVYCPIAHWTWHPNGFLRNLGVLDFAGGTVVHMSSGIAALAGAIYLGRRKAHINSESNSPANIPFVILGTGMLWFGWFGFNAGSALTASPLAVSAFITTNTASAAAMLAWISFDVLKGRKPSALGACIGAVVGLVSITPAAGFVSVGSSIFIGFAASIVSNMVVHWRSKSSIDDTLDVFPCHGVGGITGMICTGIFAREVGLINGQFTTFGYHLLAVLIVVTYTFVVSYILYKITDLILPIRVNEFEEELGLDISQHDESIGVPLYNPGKAANNA
jgi:Amt family ammonium transporter